jgi:hypothetical protein
VLLWRAFSWLHHPDWAAWAAIIAGALALYATSPHHVFYRLVVAFTLIGAVALWIEGRAWRRRRARPIDAPAERPARDGVSAASGRPGRYPIIIDCIGEARSPRQEEVRAVAARIWREGWQDRMVSHGPVASFAMRRLVFKMANAALRGDTDRRMARRSPDNDL